MTVQPGTRLGPYEIVSSLGAGGMGEVFRARDTKLGRDVALKTLPAAFVHDADRLARFKREATVLASLNHPNIAAIYGFEESTSGPAIVLELVEGPTLADQLVSGPLAICQALGIARQIADAHLDCARMHAARGNAAGALGHAARAVMEEGHAVLCERGEWVCNEKRLIESAGLTNAQSVCARPPDGSDFLEWINLVAESLSVPSSETSPWTGTGRRS